MKIFIRGLVIAGLCTGLVFAAAGSGGSTGGSAVGTGPGTGPVAGSVGGTGTTSVPTSNGTTPFTNPSSLGSSNTPPEQAGAGVGSGNVSKTTTGTAAQINQDYQNTVRLYGANSDQAKAALARQSSTRTSPSRSTLNTTNGQTYPANGTFTPDVNSGPEAAGVTNATNAGTGTGAGNAASTNGSPPAAN